MIRLPTVIIAVASITVISGWSRPFIPCFFSWKPCCYLMNGMAYRVPYGNGPLSRCRYGFRSYYHSNPIITTTPVSTTTTATNLAPAQRTTALSDDEDMMAWLSESSGFADVEESQETGMKHDVDNSDDDSIAELNRPIDITDNGVADIQIDKGIMNKIGTEDIDVSIGTGTSPNIKVVDTDQRGDVNEQKNDGYIFDKTDYDRFDNRRRKRSANAETDGSSDSHGHENPVQKQLLQNSNVFNSKAEENTLDKQGEINKDESMPLTPQFFNQRRKRMIQESAYDGSKHGNRYKPAVPWWSRSYWQPYADWGRDVWNSNLREYGDYWKSEWRKVGDYHRKPSPWLPKSYWKNEREKPQFYRKSSKRHYVNKK